MKFTTTLFTFSFKALLFFISSIAFMACEDIISPTLEKANPVLVVDAWINNKNETQVIRLTETQPYFQNTVPSGVSGATVNIVDNEGRNYFFAEDFNKAGDYTWTPPTSSVVFGKTGNAYQLNIQLPTGEVFTATSYMGRVPVIDSVTLTFEPKNAIQPDSYIAEFWATEVPGSGDTYWIKAFKNGILLNKPEEINIAFDAGFSAGGNFDGVTFITPKRRGVNPNDVDADDKAISPYQPGDSLNVEIHSLTVEAFNYMNEVVIQTNRPGGFSELFASPISNVSTNIFNVNKSGPPAVGFFTVSAVSAKGKRFDK
jgi:Domain of unknown function (DUF4249)